MALAIRKVSVCVIGILMVIIMVNIAKNFAVMQIVYMVIAM